MSKKKNIQVIDIPIIEGWSQKTITQFDPATLINWWIDVNKSGEPALIGTPGLKYIMELGPDGYVRAMHANELSAYMHVVAKDRIYKINSDFTVSGDFKIDTDSGFVSVETGKNSSGDNQVFFVDGTNIYLYDGTTNLYSKVTNINAPAFPGMVSILGGRAFINKSGTNELHIGDINNGNGWTGNLIRLGEGSYPEKIMGHATLRGRLFVMGTRCTEVWVLSETYPYIQRDPNLLLEYGCAAPGSIAIGEDRMCWLGRDKQGVTSIVVTAGGIPEKISTEELEAALQAEDVQTLTDARAFIYKNMGNIFYHIAFSDADKSFLYNFTTRTWSETRFKIDSRSIMECHAYFNGVHYVGDYDAPTILEIDNFTYTDDGEGIYRKFVSNVLKPLNGDKFIVHKLRIFMQQGTGSTAGYDYDPVLYLSLSKDNGSSFGGAQEGLVGKMGQGTWITDYYRLGYFEYGTIVLQLEHYNHTAANIFKVQMWVS